MLENITASHLAMIGVTHEGILLDIIGHIYSKYPEQIKELTIWNESVLHYLLGNEATCSRPLVLGYIILLLTKVDFRILGGFISKFPDV